MDFSYSADYDSQSDKNRNGKDHPELKKAKGSSTNPSSSLFDASIIFLVFSR